MLLLEKLAIFAFGIVCGGWLVGFIAGAHIQEREQAAFLEGRREGIEEATGKAAEPVELPGEAPLVMASREPMVEVKASSASVIAAVRSIAKREGVCYPVPCYVCPNLCKGLPAGGDAYKPDPHVAEAARAWLASHGIPVEEAAS